MFDKYNLTEIIKDMESTLIEKRDFILNQKADRKDIMTQLIAIARKNKIKHFDSSVKRSIGNATRYGQCPVTIKVWVAQGRQMLVIIRDQGQGFDYEATIAKFKAGKKYYNRGGCGFIACNKNKHSKVCWHDEGRKISILFK
jgi:hypothetical protein